MGSLSSSGVTVVSKNSDTFRKLDVVILKTSSSDDSETTLVSAPVTRTISSGSIVRDDGTVDYVEDKVWGVYIGGRSTDSRVASDQDATRDVVVEVPEGSGTVAVIPTALTPDIPQVGILHTGDKLVKSQAVGNEDVVRVSNSGAFD